jgi:hypothetical protein
VASDSAVSSPLPSALAFSALAWIEADQTSIEFENASRYFLEIAAKGWARLADEMGAMVLAQVLSACSISQRFPFDKVVQGTEILLEYRNWDGAWGEKKTGTSSVEVTAACLQSLSASGYNRVVNSRLSAWSLREAEAALATTQQELQSVRSDIQAEVKRQNKGILRDNDRLIAKLTEIEKEKKILLLRIDELEERLGLNAELAYSARELESGTRSLRSTYGVSGMTGLLFGRYRSALLRIVSSAIIFGLTWWPSLSVMAAKSGLSHVGFLAIINALRAFAGASVIYELTALFRSFTSRIEYGASKVGTSDRTLVRRQLSMVIRKWSPGQREEFLHGLARLTRVPRESRGVAARSIAREFAGSAEEYQLLGVALSLLPELEPDDFQVLLYSLQRESRVPNASSS